MAKETHELKSWLVEFMLYSYIEGLVFPGSHETTQDQTHQLIL